MISVASSARAALLPMAIGALLAHSAHSAQAADMPFFSEPAEDEAPVELGTGWYLRGDIAAAKAPALNIDGARVSPTFPNNWSIGLGGGYKYNNWFRTDVTVDYEQIYSRSGPEYLAMPCQIGAVGLPAGGPFTSSVPVYSSCSPFSESRATTMAILANAYLDLGNWAGFTPYIGAGVGIDVLFQKSQVRWYQGNLAPYAGVTWTDPYTLGTYMANWDRYLSRTYARFAYAFMGGFSYDLTDHWKADVGYRWLNLGTIEGADLFGNQIKRRLEIQQLRVGFRYMID
jgi:opacity protein-like surface antigen